MLRSLLHNEISWKCSVLGEQALLIEPEVEGSCLNVIHELAQVLEVQKPEGIVDVVPAYQSLGVLFDTQWTHTSLIEWIGNLKVSAASERESIVHEILVDYNAGLDWERVIKHTGLSKSEIIDQHQKPIYTVAMIGFLPGFIFLDGLDARLSTPRLEIPRTQIPAGSVGIGGSQTGWYSLESPGGWNLIGRTDTRIFDLKNDPPISIKAGDKVRFVPEKGDG